MLVHRIDQDWYRLLDGIENSMDNKNTIKIRKQLRDSLVTATPIFAAKLYFLSDEFSLVDCALAPLLWRLSMLGIDLPDQSSPIRSYANRLFERKAFQDSLSDQEKEYSSFLELMTA